MKQKIKEAIKRNQKALHSLVIFRRAEKSISQLEQETIKKSQLTVTQFGVLEILYNKGNLRIQDIIDGLLSTSGNMTVVIRNMVRDGYVDRVCDPNDKRASLIHLTDKGRETIESILEEHYNHIGEIFSVLTPDEQEEFMRLLKKFKL